VGILNVFPYISLCKKKCPLVGPFLADFIFMHTHYKSCLKDAVGQIFGLPVHEILKNSPNFTSLFLPLDFCKLESPKMLPTKFGSNQFSGFEE